MFVIKKRNKKSQVFSIMLVMITLALLLYAFVSFRTMQTKFDKSLGERQLEILETYQKGQNALFYLDSAADISAKEALYHVAENGGYNEFDKDMQIDGYVFWRKGKKDNFPEKKEVRKNIMGSTLDNFDNYLNFKRLTLDYNVFISGNNISFYGSIPIYLNVLSGGRRYSWKERYALSAWWNVVAKGAPEGKTQSYVGVYAVKHSHKTKLKMDLDFFEYVSNKSKKIADELEKCQDKFKNCVNKNIDKEKLIGNWNFNYDEKEKIIFFDVSNEAKEIIYNKEKGNFEIENITIKFALMIGDNIPPEPVPYIKVYDDLVSERSVIVTWKKSPTEDKENDIDKYIIYYSDTPFKDIENFADKIDQISFDYDGQKEFDEVDFTNCEENNKCKPCVYKGIDANELLLYKKLYYSKKEEVYFSFISILEDGNENPYFFAVAAIDKSGNVINNSVEGQWLIPNENYIGAYSKDDLAPSKVINLVSEGSIISWKKPEKNIDGTNLVEEDNEMTYGVYRDGHNKGTVKTSTVDWSNLPDGTYEAGIVAIDEKNNYCKENIPTISINIKKEP